MPALMRPRPIYNLFGSKLMRDVTMPPAKPEPSYLGDGVYASFDGFQIWLSNGHHENRVIAIEPSVMDALAQYAHRCFVRDHHG